MLGSEIELLHPSLLWLKQNFPRSVHQELCLGQPRIGFWSQSGEVLSQSFLCVVSGLGVDGWTIVEFIT